MLLLSAWLHHSCHVRIGQNGGRRKAQEDQRGHIQDYRRRKRRRGKVQLGKALRDRKVRQTHREYHCSGLFEQGGNNSRIPDTGKAFWTASGREGGRLPAIVVRANGKKGSVNSVKLFQRELIRSNLYGA